ncbi:mannose-6-phosphate receptor binding domain-containing protein [Lasiosphaeris hirsuta]|uniref:Mannose-6-phosphate receptor binding domain-containing protein n=1 Tax=Lasiosphaeris hirsuta TaxID=260670 RepID=A0AA40A9Y7_9PEZI|nr:mannose-6-phosphate receptor binding domain-containing protein [Lasiosphaeris hirsuta]
MKIHTQAFLALAALAGVSLAAEEKESSSTKVVSSTTSSTVTPCVATATSGAFYDLRPDTAVVVAEGAKAPKNVPTEDYLARGWDYGSNFTLNICGAVVKRVGDVEGVEKGSWKNISAYYEHEGKTYSLGLQSGTLIPRGRKLVLQYSGGSPCGLSDDRSRDRRGGVHEGAAYRPYDNEDDEEESKSKSKGSDKEVTEKEKEKDKGKEETKKEKEKGKEKAKTARRKSATISFLCDRDPEIPTAASFIGADPDECAYFFEVRSQHACAGVEPHKPGSVGPGSVFAIILLIAVLVYVVGGVFYQRTVAHARGWRQLPNYSLWSGIWGFVKDVFIILTSSCARFLPSRRGYRTLSISPTGRNRNREDENRLIDQLDEEWDD